MKPKEFLALICIVVTVGVMLLAMIGRALHQESQCNDEKSHSWNKWETDRRDISNQIWMRRSCKNCGIYQQTKGLSK